MIKYHIYLCHQEIVNPSLNLGRINSKCPQYNKFITEIIGSQQYDINDHQLPHFQLGRRFYYSKYYKYTNPYQYIESPKYNNLKQELLNNKIYRIELSLFHTYLIDATNHSLSQKAKTLIARNNGLDNKRYHIAVSLPINIAQLLCIILYTNNNELQYKFKKFGCRPIKINEKIQNIAKRNSEIGNWYWMFYQTVYFYGEDCKVNNIFYHGLNIKLLFTSFNPDFHCPISTTLKFSVAQRFGEKGNVLALKPTKSTHDVCMNVSWISCYPKEEEYLFVAARGLFIYDIRFKDIDSGWNDSHILDLSAMRLFDYIFNKRCCYDNKVLKNESQEMLMRYLSDKTFMDDIYIFNKQNNVEKLNHILFESEEYDSDCVDQDLSDYHHSNILSHLLSINNNNNENGKRLSLLFKSLYDTHCKNNIAGYLRNLFLFIQNKVKENMNKNKKIYIIKSEYNKLSEALRIRLSKLYCSDNISFIDEFRWIIKNEEFDRLKKLEIGEELIGPDFKYKLNDIDESVIFNAWMFRSDPSYPDYCGFGVEIKSLSSSIKETQRFCWSFSVKEIDYNSGVEDRGLLKNGSYAGLQAFTNKILNNIQQLTITVYFRCSKHED